MTKLNSEIRRELNIEDLDDVTGGDTPIYGMNCSANQGAAIKGIQKPGYMSSPGPRPFPESFRNSDVWNAWNRFLDSDSAEV